ncbi:NAD(P)-binding protein [Paraphaeosphaeria sporulosa]|uniref:NAD(P)-binding protein n=1 Tax=Paraphaeosphaeria sporulosa TaxID=1460663 RepID=A0A177C7L2_9PLEO|nr:NAD(P)-binding protein [Paraphaeosphaeria sporulosa]OAG02690.1 NAD(P)-binding protein [Paraphaeosphaeria sporulosa]
MPGPLPYTRHTPASTIAADNAAHIAGKVVLTSGVSPHGTGALFLEAIAAYSPALLILAGRNTSKTRATATKLASLNPSIKTRVLDLDLASQASVRRAAAEVNAYGEDYIDVLVNNAGVMAGPYRTTSDGLEMHFGTNHIGHFLFTNLVMGKLLAAPAPRVVNISSDGHRLSGIRWDDVGFSGGKTYNQWVAYGQSKTANILFTRALAANAGLTERGLRSFAVHPGVLMSTSLADGLEAEDFADLKKLDKEIGDPLGEEGASFDVKTEEEMVATHVAAAFDPRLEGAEWNGTYMEDGDVHEEKVRGTVGGREDAERLWRLSEGLVGDKFRW